MIKMLIGGFIALCITLFGAVAQAAEQPIPAMSRTVVDTTGWLNSQELLELEKRVKTLRDSRSVQLAILIVKTTKPETIEQYSLRVAEKWKVGKKGEDSGLLLTVARNDRRFRLEVGYGLEGKIPDLLAKSILDEAMKPHLRNEKPFDALVSGISAIDTTLAKEPVTKTENADVTDEESVTIPFYDDLNNAGKIVAFLLGVIGGFLLLIGGYGNSGPTFLMGFIVPIVGGLALGLLVNFAMFFFVAVVATIIAVVIALGLTIGGAIIGGAFGGGGASADW